jgi:hypothetical protein
VYIKQSEEANLETMPSEERRDDYSLELVNFSLLITHLVATNINEHDKND